MAPTRLKAAEAPIRMRPAVAAASVVAGREQHAAAGADEGGDRHQAARAEAVEQDADRDLHAGIAVEIGRGEVAEHGGADG